MSKSEKTPINQRLREFKDSLKKSTTQLAKELNVSQGGLNSAVKGDTLPSAKLLIPLSERGLSIDWLFTGEGEMMRVKKAVTNDNSEEQSEVEYLKQIIEEKERTIKTQEQVIELLTAQSQK